MARNTIAARAANPHRTFIDIHYADLLHDPASIIDSIYSAHGEPLRADGAQAVSKAALTRSDHTAGKKHAYALSDFGLTPEDVKTTFADYYSHYGFEDK